MVAAIIFEFPFGWLFGVPLLACILFMAWRQSRQRLGLRRIVTLSGLRVLALLPLVFLLAKPLWVGRAPLAAASRPVVLLVDRSESMSLEENGATRYQQALTFLRDRLLPALKSSQLSVRAMLFDHAAQPVEGKELALASPKGKRTNVGAAIGQAISSSPAPPLAIVALTDGIANENAANARALTLLADAHVPFIGVGFGSDQGACTLSLREIDAPASVGTKSSFSISAHLEMMNGDDVPSFELVLLRDGRILQQRSVAPGKGSRAWLENFQVSEQAQGVHNYAVQLLPPNLPNLKCVSTLANTSVRVSDERELRILYLQGALTWDYKFVNLALRKDPTMKLTGLTRTSKQSVFRQNVESTGELINGFPNSIEELASFRVVVLSDLRPEDLSPGQQELLARFCGELGGGVLLMGGASTFDASWQNTRLEQLLPVVFSANAGVEGLDRPFHIRLTDEALQHPVFQIAENHSAQDIWAQLPAFTHYGRVAAAKRGAQIWMLHERDDGPHGKRILMALQRYGAGLSAVLCVQNLWRWRLARDSDPQQFDRFWRQLFRFLSEVGRQDVSIHLSDQDIHPQMDVQVLLERQPNPKNILDTNRKFFVRVEDSDNHVLQEDAAELEPLRPADFKFHVEKAGVYTVTVTDAAKVPISSRPIEIRDVNVEFQDTARNMETLGQWASVSDGLAFKVEDCPEAADLVEQIKHKVEAVRRGQQTRRPIGINGWNLALVLGCLSMEYLLRKRWGLV
jgi:uncharacterized membrane protein